ncbi:hypothetical protein QBC34DRAFT_473971 [Podospora aff. communis PSN243]|uniref:Ecp2 effector protein domain-containing protein n=1 Tax=Podospora aff. communis PSN243 TaxID=3040156 RepID=A0AAV9G8P4_9PEZI|nr:hypothetical protein QBC34DRAFT_473971 [Podospora aff. communis PSN243]
MFLHHIALGLSIVTATLASPLAEPPYIRPQYTADDIQFTPGPGLPSLESLNLTALDLANAAFDQIEAETSTTPSNPLTRRAAECLVGDPRTVYRASALGCANYLDALGNTPCQLYPEGNKWGSVFCQMTIGGDYPFNLAVIVGTSNINTQSYCRHVAHAVRVAEDQCKIGVLRMHVGYENAYGNGHLGVWTMKLPGT